MKYLSKKIIAAIIISLIGLSIIPKTADAADSVWVVNPILHTESGAGWATAAATGATITEISFEWAFKTAKEILKKQLLDMMVDQIVAYIQGGGTPKFITDWPGFFRDAVDQAGGKFLQKIKLSQLCSPFKPLLSAAFIPIPTFTERTSCTLSQVGVNIDVFLKDFRQGNWIAWQEMVLRPQNNVYGAYVMAWDQYEIEKSAAQKAAASEAQASKGFLSVKRCIEWNNEGFQSCIDNDCRDYNEESDSFTSCSADCKKASCIKEETVTPGAVVGDLAAEAVGANIKGLVNAEDFKAYVAAITNALLNRMFAEGVGLLHTALSSDGGGGGGGGGGSSAQTQCAQLLGTAAYNDCIAAMQSGLDIRDFQKNYLISLIDQDLIYQNQLLGAKQATLIVLNQSADILVQLQNCQGTTPDALAQVQGAASTTASQIIQIQSDIIALQVKQQEIKAVTDILQIPALWAQVANVVNPASTYSLVLAAQSETSQKQQAMSLYQQQLIFCQQQSGGGR